MAELTDLERAILDFEAAHPSRLHAKEAQIKRHLDLSPTLYYQCLSVVIEKPAALAYDPATVNRLLRVRDAQRAKRWERAAMAGDGF